MRDFNEGMFLGFMGTTLIAFLLFIAYVNMNDKHWKSQLVEHGVAKYVVDEKTGEVSFKWNDEESP